MKDLPEKMFGFTDSWLKLTMFLALMAVLGVWKLIEISIWIGLLVF